MYAIFYLAGEGDSFSIEVRLPEVLTLIVLNVGNEAFTLNIELILLDPRLPVLTLAIPGHLLSMLSHGRYSVLILKVVMDLGPGPHLLDPFQGRHRCVFLRPFHLIFVFLVRVEGREGLTCLLELLGAHVLQEVAHGLGPDQLVVGPLAHTLVVKEVVVEAMLQGHVLIVDLLYWLLPELIV